MSDSDSRVSTVETAVRKLTERSSSRETCLVVIYGLELGKKYPITKPQTVIGRSSKVDIQIDQESVSRNHCKILSTGASLILRDMGSTNGTYVNDHPVDEYALRDGDLIKVGRCIFKFLSNNNIEAAYHEEIYRLTTIDGLTQIFNRRYFEENLEREIGRAQRYRRSLSLLMFDVDKFKAINDQHGHLAGDAILKQLAILIRGTLRKEDILARYGGEEFAITLPEIDLDHAGALAERIRSLVAGNDFTFDGTKIPVTISIGLAMLDDTDDTKSLIRLADERLGEAKTGGRNRVVGQSSSR